ncbi:MAG TPA: hypothetical protein VIK89_00385 [Cytophagaceae bacterium]
MNTLKEQILIYDEACPMCRLYTGAFIKSGMLDENGRQAYAKMQEEVSCIIDKQRARNEIALVDTRTNTVVYGVDSLFKVIGNSFPLLNKLFNLSWFRFIIRKLYSFISYNRKVIIPDINFEAPNACVPDYHAGYRWLYIVISWLLTSIVLFNYSTYFPAYIPESNALREFFICGGQIFFQFLLVSLLRKGRVMEYLGNMMTVSLGGAFLLLLPMLLVKLGVAVLPELFLIYFVLVVGVMFIEHVRRVKILKLNWGVSIGWVMYRLLVVVLISIL